MKKRLLSALLTFCMVLTLLPVSALAAEYGQWPGDSYDWNYDSEDSDALTPADEYYGFDGGVGDDIHLSKTAVDNGDGTYTVTLSATADEIITAKPTEVVFVIDGSGSMNWCEEKPDDGDTGWIGEEGEWHDGKKGQDWTSGHYHGNGDHGRDGVYCTYVEKGEQDSRWVIALEAIESMMNDLGNEGVSYQFVVYNGYQRHGDWYTQAISYDDFDDVRDIDPLGGTPLVKGVDEALECFRNSGNSNKVMIIVADGASDDNDYPSTRYGDFADFRDDTENNEVYTVGFTFSNDDFEDLATDGDHAFLATNPGELENSMKEISQNIKGLITDPLGKDVELVDDDIKVEVSGGQDYGRCWVTGDTINWTCEDGLNGTVTLTYTVRIKDDVVDQAGHYRIPLNDQATLNYSYEMYGYSESHSVDFPEPEAEFDAATLTVKYKLEDRTVDTKSEWVKVEDGAAFETEIPEKDDEYTHNNKTYWVDRVEGSVDTPLETKDYEVTVYLTDDEPDHGSDITPTAHPITIEVVLDGDMSDRKTDSEVGNYIDVNPFQNNTDNGEAAWDEGTYHSDSGTVTYSITYYDCKDIGFEANPGYVIEAIDADLVFGQSGCKGIYTTDANTEEYGDYMADNVKGSSTVTVYVRSLYTIQFHDVDGNIIASDTETAVADTTGLTPVSGNPSNMQNEIGYFHVNCGCNNSPNCEHKGWTDSYGGQIADHYSAVFSPDETITLPQLPTATGGMTVSGWYLGSANATGTTYVPGASYTPTETDDGADEINDNVINFYSSSTTNLYDVTIKYEDLDGNALKTDDTIPDQSYGSTVNYSDYALDGQSIGNHHYVLWDTKTTPEDIQITDKSFTITQDTTITLIYALDDWKDGDEKDPAEPDEETGGDNIPDKYQVLVNYTADQGGTISGRTQEVITIYGAENNFDTYGNVTAEGTTAAAEEHYTFQKWTVAKNNAEPDDYPGLNAETGTIYFTGVTGGDVYILTAYFTDTRTPGLTITKTASVNGDVINSDETVDVGDVITYTLTVTNTGSTTFTDITVSDNMWGDKITTATMTFKDLVNYPIDVSNGQWTMLTGYYTEFEPGDTWRCTYTYTVTQDDVDAGTITNVAAVTSPELPGGEEETEETVNVGNPKLSIEKTVSGMSGDNDTAVVGDELTYTITVTNEGQETITSFRVEDSLWGTGKVETITIGAATANVEGGHYQFGGTLYGGDSWTCTYTYTVPEGVHSISNTASVVDVPGGDEPEDTVTVPVEDPLPESGDIVVTKTADKTTAQVGDTITYTITITNSGETIIDDIVVDDSMWEYGDTIYVNGQTAYVDIDGKYAIKAADLEPGSSIVITYTYTIQEADEGREISNTVTVGITEPEGPTSKDTVTVTVPEEGTYTLIYDANGGSFGNNEETLTIPNLSADTYTLTATDGYNEPTNGNYVFIGWSTAPSGSPIGAGEEIPDCITEVTLNDANPTQTVYAVWGEDANDDNVADAQQVFIEPAPIVIYTGGEGYNGAVQGSSDSEVGTTSTGLPEPGFYITLPHAVDAELKTDAETGEIVNGALDLSNYLSFSYYDDAGNEIRHWNLERYDMGSGDSQAYNRFIYRMLPDTHYGIPIRLQFTDEDGNITITDTFPISMDELSQNYSMTIYDGGLDQKAVTANIEGIDGNITVGVDSSTLTVRGVTAANGVPTTTEVLDSAPDSQLDNIQAHADGEVTYYINDSDLEVRDPSAVALLVDELVDEGVDTLLAEAEDRLGLAWYEDYEYQTQYLDLVDTSNGNAYVTLGEGDSVDIHWPMPNGTSRWNTEFYVVHFDGLDRNFDDLDAQLDSGNVDLQVYTLGDGLRIENGNLVFTTDTFSPFVLIWQDSDRDWPDDDDDDDNDRPSHDDDDDNDRPEQEDPAPELDKESHIAYVSGTPEGTIEPNAYITREEVATIFFRLLTDRSRANYITDYNPFPDVDSSRWSFYPIVTMNNAGIMHGYDDGNFAPSGYITRAEFAVVAAQFSDAEYTGADLFSDISGHWAREYINRAASEGWISGYPDGSFGPDDYITRAQVMALVNEVLDRAPDADYMLDDMITWPDNADESAWYYEDVQEATNSHSYVWRNSGRTSEEWEDLIDTRTLDELVRDAFNGVGISY